MVRTKADSAVRVAAGGKAPKKTAYHSPSPSPTEKFGKDSFPVNKYCPRETPAWQKKITNFFDGPVKSDKSPKTDVTKEVKEIPNENNNIRRQKRSSSVLDESNEMDADEVEFTTKKFKTDNGTKANQNEHDVDMDE